MSRFIKEDKWKIAQINTLDWNGTKEHIISELLLNCIYLFLDIKHQFIFFLFIYNPLQLS